MKSEEGGGWSQLHRPSKSFLGAHQEASECVDDGILSYGSDLSQEVGPAYSFEPTLAPCSAHFEAPILDFQVWTWQDIIVSRWPQGTCHIALPSSHRLGE